MDKRTERIPRCADGELTIGERNKRKTDEKGRMVMKTGTCLKTLERLQADDCRGHARGCGGHRGGSTIWTQSMSAKDAKKR